MSLDASGPRSLDGSALMPSGRVPVKGDAAAARVCAAARNLSELYASPVHGCVESGGPSRRLERKSFALRSDFGLVHG